MVLGGRIKSRIVMGPIEEGGNGRLPSLTGCDSECRGAQSASVRQ